MNEAELMIIKLWLKWQNQTEMFKGIKVKRVNEFSIDDLSQELDNLLKGMRRVYSESFIKLAMQKVARKTVPDMTDEQFEEIRNEIDSSAIDVENFVTMSDISESDVESE